MFGRVGNALPPTLRDEGQKLLQAAAYVLVQVCMPRRDQRNPKAMSDPKTQDPHIPWPRNVHQIRVEGAELSDHPVPIAAEQWVAVQIMVQRECSHTSLQLQCGEGLLAGHLRLSATMNGKERKLLALSKRGKLPANSSYPVSFMECIGEESNAKRSRQGAAPS